VRGKDAIDRVALVQGLDRQSGECDRQVLRD
jgi:hypothetical protein